MTADRPTGPATRRRSGSLTPAQHAAFMEGMKLGEKAGRAYSCHEAATAERARILAALPEALLLAVASEVAGDTMLATQWWKHWSASTGAGWSSGELAAALAAAIERVLGE